MPGRASQPRKADEEREKNFVEAEKDTKERIDALKGEVSKAAEDEESTVEPQGHFHTREVHRGPCHGGPMDGMEGVSRYPNGFVLMDKADSRAWVYDRHGDGYIARGVQPLDNERSKKAAEEASYDVRAYDVETMKRH